MASPVPLPSTPVTREWGQEVACVMHPPVRTSLCGLPRGFGLTTTFWETRKQKGHPLECPSVSEQAGRVALFSGARRLRHVRSLHPCHARNRHRRRGRNLHHGRRDPCHGRSRGRIRGARHSKRRKDIRNHRAHKRRPAYSRRSDSLRNPPDSCTRR
jgi:hypothetical protein